MDCLPVINRQANFAALQKTIDSARKLDATMALLLVNIGNLSRINHRFGYQCGDEVLAHCFDLMQSCSKTPGMVFRVGDRTFCYIMPIVKSPALVALVLNKVKCKLEHEFCIGTDRIELDVKVGVLINAAGKLCPQQTMLAAERSLGEARLSRTPFALVGSAEEDERTDLLEQSFNETLAENAFELYYQPKIDMASGEVGTAEALLRWRLPDQRLISPEKAVALAENTGQGFALASWVVHSAVRQIRDWDKQGLKMNLAVNIQADLVQNQELFTLVQDALAIWGVEEDRLTLEITESAFIEDQKAGFDNLSNLKNIGVRLSIDDFGTGYSSLSYFKQIPAHELKIDQSFVRGMLASQQDQFLVQIIINLASLFQLKVVAEGIEDEATYNQLKMLGCHYGQGYYVAKPMPAAEFVAWLSDRAAA